MTNQASSLTVVPLPATVDDLLAQRRPGAGRTLNDYVEDLHVMLRPRTDYRALLDAVYDSQAVEGSLVADTLSAARMIRETAIKEELPQVAGEKLATLGKSLKVVMRRYHMGRKERAEKFSGPIQPSQDHGI